MTDAMLNRFLTRAKPGLTSAEFLRGFPSKTIEAEVELAAIADRIHSSEAGDRGWEHRRRDD